MDPIIDNDWLGCKNEPCDDSQLVGNIAKSWQWREMGINPQHSPKNKTVLENIAEDVLVQKPLQIRCCDLPGYPRSTFLMVFSPDGTKVASTHGNHNVYVSELASGKHVRILKGHPRTPWCIAFHPSHPQLIGSGCLGGQVRVWDLSGGSEVWTVGNETVIASIAFHPRDQLLVIATFNELYFWDWSQPAPFTKVCTNNANEKVRYVAFDSLGYKLITGISVWAPPGSGNILPTYTSHNSSSNNQPSNRRDPPSDGPEDRPAQNSSSAQELIVNSYQNLVQRYDSLVRNYQRLFMARHQLGNTPSTSTTDRGTDPMETDTSVPTRPPMNWTSRSARIAALRNRIDNDPSHQGEASDTNGDAEASSSRLLNLDVLTIDSNTSGSAEADGDADQSSGANTSQEISFGSRLSAFQRLLEPDRPRTSDSNERTTRLLPNPFSSVSNGLSRSNTISFSSGTQASDANAGSSRPSEPNTGSSRTSVYTSHRLGSPSVRYFLQRRRNSSYSQQNTSTSTSPPRAAATDTEISNGNRPHSSRSQRPTMTNSSTQISPAAEQTINESLDLIRDILRDSGTRLLNLITNMSLTTLESVERSIPRRVRNLSGAPLRGILRSPGSSARPRLRPPRPTMSLFESILGHEFLSSESDSENEHLEVNMSETRDAASRPENPNTANSTESGRQATNRMVVELSVHDGREENHNADDNMFNISVSSNRFRVRSHSTGDHDNRPSSSRTRNETPMSDRSHRSSTDMDTNRPSTSRDNYWINDPLSLSPNVSGSNISSEEAFRKVRFAVNALHKHTVHLSDVWLKGSCISMRDLKIMWENLRRRVLSLHRQTERQDVPSYFTRGLLERCRLLTQISSSTRNTDSPARPTNTSRNNRDAEDGVENNNDGEQPQGETNVNGSLETDNGQGPSTSTTNDSRMNETRQSQRRASQLRSLYKLRNSLAARRRLQTNYRLRLEEEFRRRAHASRWGVRHSTRPNRQDTRRASEVHSTRNEIRMRAMQVLSIIFKMMMDCLEERGLSQLIVNMLRMLKKALALTCLMLMTNRLNRRDAANTPAVRNEEPMDTNEDDDNGRPRENGENTESTLPNTQSETSRNNDSNNSTSSWPSSDSDDDKDNKTPKATSSTSRPSTSTDNIQNQITANIAHIEAATQRWSNRLAVQIADVNRNNSVTARTRREVYLECKKQKALHRTNPNAHPITKKKVLPPCSNYRIPAVRYVPSKKKPKTSQSSKESEEPVAGPSNVSPNVPPNAPGPSGDNGGAREQNLSRSETMNEFEHRVNLFRIAHMHAIRLRTAARTRLRRLQTIRLYTPSSVREMFAMPSNSENQSDGQSPLNNAPEISSRRTSGSYRPHILTTRNDLSSREGHRPFDSILNNVAVPLVQVNNLAVNEGQGLQPQRLPRIHEYLQPIILAQNALAVEEGGGPGVGGLFESGFVDALPSPTHRVQAWDFTKGDTPDIADNTKNVVVQRCKIHNDASIDISKDGRLLVALLPVPRLRNTNHWLGVYCLEWGRLGQCLHTAVLEQSAVSVALSPTARHLAVGLGSRRFSSVPHARNNVFALLYRLSPLESSSRTGLSPIKELEQNWEQGFTSLNCLRWAPQPGQGLVYANNTGQLIIMS